MSSTQTEATAPFSLRIFVADGDPAGLRLVERSNWIGRCVVFPRPLYPQVRSRGEFAQTGVYILLGPREDGEGERIYIGEGDPVRPRLENHYANKDFWTRAVFFVAGPGQLNKAHVQYLEARLVALAVSAKRTPLENGNRPAEPSLSEADQADMDVFLQNMLGILPILGIHAFERSQNPDPRNPFPTLYCQAKGVKATGRDTPQGFIVEAGSHATPDETPSLQEHFSYISDMRSELLTNGVLVATDQFLTFTQDYTFSSPSTAAAVVLGRSSNGRVAWKDENGRTLKEIQEAQAVASSDEEAKAEVTIQQRLEADDFVVDNQT